MNLKEIIEKLNLSVKCVGNKLDNEIIGGYASDLLSDVIANSQKRNIWITMQVHVNIVAVAVLKELSAIVIVNGREPNEDTLKKAQEENIVILSSKLPAFKLVGKLYELGVSKN
jgi:serine kinase of HPr protein (carbohydrate metabolism regulator)